MIISSRQYRRRLSMLEQATKDKLTIICLDAEKKALLELAEFLKMDPPKIVTQSEMKEQVKKSRGHIG